MRLLPAMLTKWRAGVYVGSSRPVARVTVQLPRMKLYSYSLTTTYSVIGTSKSPTGIPSSVINPQYDSKHGRTIQNVYADFLFHPQGNPKELPSVRSVTWSRAVDQDVATCTITLTNTEILDDAQVPVAGEIDQPGYYSPFRGESAFSSQWGHISNEFSKLLLPDSLVRTYEGYGCDPEVSPELDPNLAITGTWMIDKVSMNARGELTLECRDLGRLLLEQQIFDPVVPKDFYPLSFENWSGKVFLGNRNPKTGKLRVSIDDTSNTPWIGSGTVSGHKPAYVLDGKPSSYWLSIGNDAPSRRFAYEWVQVKTHGNMKVNEVRFRPVRKGYTAYVSVFANGSWQGERSINYHEDGIGQNGSDIAYVKSKKITDEGEQVIHFSAISGVTKVRVTFGNLQYFQQGPYHYRAGIREISVFGSADKTTPSYGQLTPGPIGSNPGKYYEYTDVVKLLCAWAGFLWPKSSYFRATDGTHILASFSKNDDKVLGRGVNSRLWGDFQDSGTSGPSPISADNFDKKSLMDGIKYVKDILGFHFAIDETGAVQWRMPNFHDLGNWITLSTSAGRTTNMLTLHEDQLLTDFTATLDSANVREKILVSDLTGKLGSTARGYNPNPVGLRRLGAWTDKNFSSKQETLVMAELIAIRALFSYRTGRASIPGFPGIQIDDQVRIVERVTSEGYVNYVSGISSSLDMVSGTYTYDLTTYWLGIDPKSKWLLPKSTYSPLTAMYIDNLLENYPDFREDDY